MGKHNKKLPHTLLSDVQCSHQDEFHRRCQTFLKQNVVDRDPEADLCYKHWCIANGKPTSAQRKEAKRKTKALIEVEAETKTKEAGA